ncbi:MAG TPA: GIY-YIG nuclease family protein [Stenomitos sp.]
MQAASECPSLAELELIPYIDPNGQLPHQFEGQIGIYAIYTQEGLLAYIGYSRDVSLSLRQHLVRRPEQCFGVKVCTVGRPDRTLLEAIKASWIDENGTVPIGNGVEQALWEQPIDIKTQMQPAEVDQYTDEQLDDTERLSILKKAARRVEQDILQALTNRGVTEPLRFNPKLKENGLLDLK